MASKGQKFLVMLVGYVFYITRIAYLFCANKDLSNAQEVKSISFKYSR